IVSGSMWAAFASRQDRSFPWSAAARLFRAIPGRPRERRPQNEEGTQNLESYNGREMQPARRRETVAEREKRIRLEVRRKKRRSGRLPQIEKLLGIRREPRLVVEHIQEPRFDRHLTPPIPEEAIGSHQIEVRPRRIAVAA